MRGSHIKWMIPAILLGQAVWAADSGVSSASSSGTGGNALRDEAIGFRPQVGFLDFTNSIGETSNRLAFGATFDLNALKYFDIGLNNQEWTLGPSTGLIFSHLGPADSDFLGFNSVVLTNSVGSNFFYIPLDVKCGYRVTDRVRAGAHAGGNLTYRSDASSMQLGASSATTNNDFSIFPNAGLDLEYALGSGTSLTLRPDWTLTPGDNIFSGTLALAFNLGSG